MPKKCRMCVPTKKESDEQDEAVHGHFARQSSSCRGRIVARQRQKNRAAAKRVDDGEKRAQDKQDVLGGFQQAVSPRRQYSETK